MRRHGSHEALVEMGCQDHACLVYGDDEAFLRAAVAFLREGLEAGQRLMYVGSAPVADMRRHVAGLGDVDGLIASGTLQLASTAATYSFHAVDGDEQSAVYGRAIERALADGFTGLRTLAEMTPVLARPGNRDSLVRWEARADRIMAQLPWSALCCYDRRRLGRTPLAPVAAVHPVGCGDSELTPFRVFSARPDRLAVGGSLDAFAREGFDRVLDLAAPDQDFVLDLSPLEFVDHEGVLAISTRAREQKAPRMAVEGWPYTATRIAEIMGLPL